MHMHTHMKEMRKETLLGFPAAMRGANTCLMAVSPGGFTYPASLLCHHSALLLDSVLE